VDPPLHFVPRDEADVTLVELIETTVELGSLLGRQRYGLRRGPEALPQLADEAQTLFRRELLDIDGGRAHATMIGALKELGNGNEADVGGRWPCSQDALCAPFSTFRYTLTP